jgi:ornithine--oxo-acid transaminase
VKVNADPGLAGRLKRQQDRFGFPEPRSLDVVAAWADGVRLWDVQGHSCLDFEAAAGAAIPGHGHARIAAALVEQCLRLCALPRDVLDERMPPLLEKLCERTGFEACTLLPGPREALDTAVGAVQTWAGRPGPALLVCGSHAPPALPSVPFGDLSALLQALTPDVAAVLVEPVDGPALHFPSRSFLRDLRDICHAQGRLLILDERRSGLGRTGRLFAFEHAGVRPDGLLVGEALGGGFLPMGAWLTSRDMPAPREPRIPFQGSPLASAVASATLDVLVEERLPDRAAELGAYFLARIRDMGWPCVREVRGLGLWVALDLARGTARSRRQSLAREGLLCGEGGPETLVFSPPLVVTREHLDEALERLEKVLGRT